jgi:hypothetical protein
MPLRPFYSMRNFQEEVVKKEEGRFRRSSMSEINK